MLKAKVLPKPRPIKTGVLSVAKMVRRLMDDSQTVYTLADHTGLHPVTVRRFMKAMIKERAAHVCAWERDARGRECTPVYTLGEGRQAPRKKMTAAERKAKSRDKMKAIKLNALFAGPTLEVTND